MHNTLNFNIYLKALLFCAILSIAVLRPGYAADANPPIVFEFTPTNDSTPTWWWESGGGGIGIFRVQLDSEAGPWTVTADTFYEPANSLVDGEYTLYVQEQDSAGDWSESGFFTLVIDTVPPAGPIVWGISVSTDSTPRWTWISGGGGDGHFGFQLDGDDDIWHLTTELSFTPADCLQDGEHILYVQELDQAGNWSESGAFRIYIDALPLPPIVTAPALTNDPRPSWTWSSSCGGNGTFRYQLDSNTGAWSTTTDTFFTPTADLGEGRHVLYVQEADNANHWSESSSFDVEVDLSPPDAPTVSGYTPTSDTTPTWLWSSSEGNGKFRFKFGDDDFSTGAIQTFAASYTPVVALPDGEHTLYLQEQDPAGNWSATQAFTIEISSTAPAPSTFNITVEWQYEENLLESITGFEICYKTDVKGPPYDIISVLEVDPSGDYPLIDGKYNFESTINNLKDSNIYFFAVRAFSIQDPPYPTLFSDYLAFFQMPPLFLSDRDSGSQILTNDLTVNIALTGVPGNPAEMMLAEDEAFSINNTGWIQFLPTNSFTFSDASDGLKTISVKFRDASEIEIGRAIGSIEFDTPPTFQGYSSIDYTNQSIDVNYSEDGMQNALVEANYTFYPLLEFAGPGESDDITDLGGGIYRLAMKAIASHTIYTLTISDNITDSAGSPVSPASITINDDDGDLMAGDWEIANGLDPLDPFDAWLDADGDGFINLAEFNNGTDPLVDNGTLPDLDVDGMPDAWEVANGLDPDSDDADGDPDHDTLTNLQEYMQGTDPWVSDTDRDGIGDGTEVAMATNPLDADSTPQLTLATSNMHVTDVTPHSMALVWTANQAVTGFANVFSDPAGHNLVKGLVIVDESAVHPPAGENGVMKVSISGLAANTTYYYRMVTVSSEGVLVEPSEDVLPGVQTEASSKPVSNDIIAHRILQSDGTTFAEGALLIATVEGADYPLTGWVGEGFSPPWVFIDLNNLFSVSDHNNLELTGGEVVTLESIGGFMGIRLVEAAVPPETGGIQFPDPAPCPELEDQPGEYNDASCTLDDTGPIIDAGQITPAPGALIADNIPLISAGYSDQYSDIDSDSVRLVVDGEDVTAKTALDSAGLEYTPTATLADSSHSVILSVSDQWGNKADPFTWTFTVDSTAPEVVITQPEAGAFLNPGLQTVRWSVLDENLAGIILSLNGITEILGPDAGEAQVELKPGLNLIELIAFDELAHATSISIKVTLDGDFDGDGIVDHEDPDDDNDLMPDSWELANDFDPYHASDAALDNDEDGYANLTEYTAGTDPNDVASYPTVTLGVNHIIVTDVRPDGFAVIWQATEASTCSLLVYDETGTLLGNHNLVSESALHQSAEDIGVMKVRVSGLAADTAYYFQVLTISKANGLALFTPIYPQLMEVITESGAIAVANDTLEQMIYDENGNPADGALLVASVAGGGYPVTAWVGQDVVSPWARVDLNQIYSALTHENMQLQGDEELTLWSFGGQLGNFLNIQKVPQPAGEDRQALPDVVQLSRETGVSLDLKIDLNVIGIPFQSAPALTSHGLLLYLKEQAGGDPGVVENIKRYNNQTGNWETAAWFQGVPAGINFKIKAGEAYLVYMQQDMDGIRFDGIARGAAIDLAPGLNLVCLPAAAADFEYSSYEMLVDAGDSSQVASIRRYNVNLGWQTTSWFFGFTFGALYSTSPAEGYLIYMNNWKVDWRPY